MATPREPDAGSTEPSPRSADEITRNGLDSSSIYDVNANDPAGILIDRTGMPAQDIAQITELMSALGALREAEQQLAAASRRYMKLNTTDMRAIHYLVVCKHTGAIATPSGMAHHLGISTASVTKLLDRLERAGHIVRAAHPSDRRALAISVTPSTHHAAMETVGRQQSRRFHAAARLTAQERSTVIRFLRDMTNEISLGSDGWD